MLICFSPRAQQHQQQHSHTRERGRRSWPACQTVSYLRKTHKGDHSLALFFCSLAHYERVRDREHRT